MSKTELIQDREYWFQQKERLTLRLASKQGKAFDQVMKQIDKANSEISKLNKMIKHADPK